MGIHKASLVIFLFIQVAVPINSDNSNSSCLTSQHRQGQCKSITDCPTLNKILQHRPLNQDLINYLKESHCGFSGTIPKVCCPDVNLLTDRNTNGCNVKSNLLPNDSICGNYAEDRIVTGENASLTKYPWNALLTYKTENNQKQYYCAGVLISERYVLTAAHCINGRKLPNNTKLVSVRLGEHNLLTNLDCESWNWGKECVDPPVDIPVEQTIVHNDYNPDDPNQYHDIALVRLQSKVLFTSFIGPVCLSGLVENYTNKTLGTTGWGIYDNMIKYQEKKNIIVVVKEASNCETALKTKLGPNQLCVGKVPYLQSCADDSGGSLIDINVKCGTFYAVGVMSFGSCNIDEHLRVYTRIDQYIDWIISKLKL